jgi:hypothetical protein
MKDKFLISALVLLEILGCCHDHKSNTCSKVVGQGKINFCTGCASDQSQERKHTRAEGQPWLLSPIL